MKKISCFQGSPEWLAWRKGLLTATDAAILSGVSPYVTPYEGWQRKIGQIPEQIANSAMLRGQRDEPIARDMFIEQYGIAMTPCCIESEVYPFLGASLDGISDCGKYLLEIKSTAPVDEIPIYHMYQMQHQLLCTDNTAKICFYVTIWNNQIYVKEVYPDIIWVQDYLNEAKKFWECVVFFEPPEISSKDYKDMNGRDDWNFYADEYRKISEEIKKLEEVKDKHKKELIKLCGEDNGYGHGVKVLKKITKGRIDFENIPELSQVDLEKYRKESTSSWTIMLDKKS